MATNKMVLQNAEGDGGHYGIGASIFHFAVDTCENFKFYTKNENCVDNDVVIPLIDTFRVTTKLS